MSASSKRSWTGSAFALALGLASTLAPSFAQAEAFSKEEMARGIKSTPAQCATHALTVWVTVRGEGFCIRYYISTAGGEGPVPVVFLQGDKLGRINRDTHEFEDTRGVIRAEALQRFADKLSIQTRTTAIYLGRMGLDGSSGHHRHRRSWLEVYVTQAALDAIKKKHGFRGFHLAGQSGGAGLIGVLIGLRDDVQCAVPGAGPLARTRPAKKQKEDPYLEMAFSPPELIETIARRPNLRILVVTDPGDKKVGVRMQTLFVEALRRAGADVYQFFVEATDDNRHGVTVYTRAAVSACVAGLDNEAITQQLAQLQERHLAAARERKQRQAAAQPSEPVQQPQPAQPAPRAQPAVQPAVFQRPAVTHSNPRPAVTHPARRPAVTHPAPPPTATEHPIIPRPAMHPAPRRATTPRPAIRQPAATEHPIIPYPGGALPAYGPRPTSGLPPRGVLN